MTPARHSRKDRFVSPEHLRTQLRALLPELRQALENRWTLRGLLASYGQDARLLDHLERLGAVQAEVDDRPHRWRRWRWTASEDDARLVELLLVSPGLYPPRVTVPATRWKLARRPKPCSRCERPLDVAGPRPAYLLLETQARHRTPRRAVVCPRCVRPTEHPTHELRLTKLLTDLYPLEVLFPEDLRPWAVRLHELGTDLLRVPAGSRSALHQLGRDLRELASWLRHAEVKLRPTLQLLREASPSETDAAAFELAETIAEHPAYPALSAVGRRLAEATLCHDYRTRQVTEATKRLREVQQTATRWLLDLRQRLHHRSLFQTPTP